jgi:chemosensory pili system protein ChpA (sensor histidine kinase/response regulator)
MRCLHTAKGSARMAGAMRLGELVHEMETRIEAAMQLVSVPSVVIEDLQGQFDHALSLFDDLQRPSEATRATRPDEVTAPLPLGLELEPDEAEAPAAMFTAQVARGSQIEPERPAATVAPFIRVRADVLDRLVDHAGEVSIARSKLETEVGTLRGSLTDLTENIQRLRNQLREVEIQADAQIQARSDQLARESATFDPLEFDRFSRLQELTRMLAESVEDVAMVQSTMLKGLQLADNDLSAQSRLTRELQQQLMRVRLVPFSNVSERLYRVARQTGKEVGKRVHLEIVGGTTEIDRGVLERMSGPFEHLVRNAIVHGIEEPETRQSLGKPESGELRIDVKQEGNEIIVVFADDGGGLDLERIRQRAVELNLLDPNRQMSERELAEFVFAPGFSTAREVTELAGRGIGMDVVRSELASFGGRIVVGTEAGRGTRFTAYLPLTLAVTQVVLASVGGRRFAIPSAMVQQVRRFKASDVEAGLREGTLSFGSLGSVVLRPLAQLLGIEAPLGPLGRQTPVAMLRSGEDRLAVVVDDLTPNQEVVVKSVGSQVARLTGVLGATILGSGEIVLIINPVQLIGRAPEPAPMHAAPAAVGDADAESEALGATIMVVDDSLTVRRVTQRLLERQGFNVLLAKDGVDALRQMQDALPDVLLVDIEMPRMDGYDLTRAVRSNAETQAIPILMITSRTAGKHRSLAFELGVNEYLGKPYQEDELLRLIRRHLAARTSA